MSGNTLGQMVGDGNLCQNSYILEERFENELERRHKWKTNKHQSPDARKYGGFGSRYCPLRGDEELRLRENRRKLPMLRTI
jgi:hypothetical protein